MTEKVFVITPAPHVVKPHSVKTMMLDTIIALVPAGIGAVMFFGWYSGLLILTSVVFAVLSELFVNILRKQKPTVTDLSCIITGLLFAYTLPPRLPLWIAIIGVFVGIVFGKHIYGGLGYNPFNPALIGRAFVHIAFPQQMGNFDIEAISSATPLTILKHFPEQISSIPPIKNLIIGNYLGSLGETSVVLLFIIFLGHAFTHNPQPVHFIGSTSATPYLLICIASNGQTSTQSPNPKQPYLHNFCPS